MATMTAPQPTADRRGTVPVACSLTPADRTAQADHWARLIARALTERTETAEGLRLSFRSEPEVEEELRALVAVESECCPWAAWTVETIAGSTVLDVSSEVQGVAVFCSMFTSPVPA